MNIWHLRSAPKGELKYGSWGTGKMNRSSFPLSRSGNRAYRLGTKFRWCVITFEADGLEYRILVAYRTDKEQFIATLGVNEQGDTKIVASLEFHGTHAGWHVHYARDQMDSVPAGIKRGPWVARWNCRPHDSFVVTGRDADSKALTIVSDVFGLQNSAEDGVFI